MKLFKKIAILSPVLWFTSCASHAPLNTTNNVNIEKYMGTWYELERLPNSFEEGLKCVTATYTLKEDGEIEVLNQGYGEDGWEKAKGSAKQPNSELPGELRVSFFKPFYSDYYILEIDADYQYVLVGSPSREYLWILSRTIELDPGIVETLKLNAQSLGFDTDKMIRVDHTCAEKEEEAP